MIISVYGESNSRLLYVLDFIQGYFEQVEFQVVPEIPGANDIAINYSHHTDIPGIQVLPSGLMEEFGSGTRRPELDHVDEDPVLFGDHSKFGFDVFSAIFYMISRYEEYHSLAKDRHERFPAKASVAHEYGFLDEPIVDLWVGLLAKAIEGKYGKTLKKREHREMYPSIDIDEAWAYRNKSSLRTIGAQMKDALSFDLHGIRKRSSVLSHKKQDPYDTYDYIEERFMNMKDPLVFVQIGNYGRYDKNVDHRNEEFTKLLKRLDLTTRVGLHPSYASFSNKGLIKTEKERLEHILGRNVNCSRFHFLRFRLPDSYRALIEYGFEHDHSMGYADAYGFRAGTSRPFYWYDIDREEQTNLLIHPFVYMDGTLNQYMGMDTKDAVKVVDHLFDQIECGNYEFIWHNSTLNDQGIWTGWKEVFEHTLQRGKKWERSEIL